MGPDDYPLIRAGGQPVVNERLPLYRVIGNYSLTRQPNAGGRSEIHSVRTGILVQPCRRLHVAVTCALVVRPTDPVRIDDTDKPENQECKSMRIQRIGTRQVGC